MTIVGNVRLALAIVGGKESMRLGMASVGNMRLVVGKVGI